MESALVLIIAVAALRPEVSHHLADAYTHQSHLDKRLKEIEERLLTDTERRTLGHIGIVARVAIEKRIQIEWRFP